MQYLKNTTRLHDRKYVMIEQQISPPIREASWWQFKIPEYFPQPSHKHELGENQLRSQTKNSLAHTTKHVPQMAPHHNPTCKIHPRHVRQKVCNDRTANFPPHTWSLLVTVQNTWVFPPTITQARISWGQTAHQTKKSFSAHNQTCSANGTAS